MEGSFSMAEPPQGSKRAPSSPGWGSLDEDIHEGPVANISFDISGMDGLPVTVRLLETLQACLPYIHLPLILDPTPVIPNRKNKENCLLPRSPPPPFLPHLLPTRPCSAYTLFFSSLFSSCASYLLWRCGVCPHGSFCCCRRRASSLLFRWKSVSAHVHGSFWGDHHLKCWVSALVGFVRYAFICIYSWMWFICILILLESYFVICVFITCIHIQLIIIFHFTQTKI